MRYDKQLWILGAVGSVALHLILFLLFALGLRLPSAAMVKTPPPPPEPEITVIMAATVAPPTPTATPLPKREEPAPAPTPPKPKPKQPDLRYVRTSQNEEAKDAPANAAYKSDHNTVASAKDAPADKGDPTMPNTKGVDLQTMELANREFKEGELKHDSAPVPTQPPAKSSPPTVAALPVPPTPPTPPAPPIPKPPKPPTPQTKQPLPQPPQPKKPQKPESQIAKKEDAPAEKILREAKEAADEKGELPKPKPVAAAPKPDALPEMKAPAEEPLIPRAIPLPSKPAMRQPTLDRPPPLPSVAHPEKDAFMPQTRIAKMRGTISNRSHGDSFDAAATPSGMYMSKLRSPVEQLWQRYARDKGDFVSPGKVRLHFYVNKAGKPEDISFVFSEANAVFADFTLSSVLEAKFPPIPGDLLPMLDKERFEVEMDFVIY